MSLLREAERCIANQKAYAGLNAFVTPLQHSAQCLSKVRDAELRKEQGKPRSKVDGRLISVKDNICTHSLPTTCASGILDGFTSPFSATVIEQLEDAGAVVAGKTNLDEFGMGSHSINSRFGAVRNPRQDRGEYLSAGGSSGGSAVAVAAGQCYAALGTDTGGSVRLPAAYTGTVGFKPSYGLISRWGVVAPPLASRGASSPLRIGIPIEYNITELAPSVRHAWLLSLEHLRKQGHTIHPVSLPVTRLALSAYYVLAPAEASSNLAKYDGVRYGNRYEDYDSENQPDGYVYARTRGELFGPEVKRRILLGTFSLSADAIDNYFIQAQRVRRLVQHDFNAIFKAEHPLVARSEHKARKNPEQADVDVIVCPTSPSPPPQLSSLMGPGSMSSPLNAYVNDVFTVPASLAGLPAVSVPVYVTDDTQKPKKPDLVGIQVVGQYGDDALVLKAAELLEGKLLVGSFQEFSQT
ncbi:Trimeric GatFAB AmidoTransferase(AdT) complex subunit [Monascus purpureus]|uniref:Glutamyl-tRNA(Gln) amidotransferase subunit A, mitochondrial n=1 Tax=Monascus purpureus TaxID=5098 RepID=A0A507QMJ6_MONPU|nr:Trimeric GatFAB AmidoTransferase(AdT) complex subunit [Monascus purpureus]